MKFSLLIINWCSSLCIILTLISSVITSQVDYRYRQYQTLDSILSPLRFICPSVTTSVRRRIGESPVYYIRLPAAPSYFYRPNFGFVQSHSVAAVQDPFQVLPVSFNSNGKPSGIYQWQYNSFGQPEINKRPSIPAATVNEIVSSAEAASSEGLGQEPIQPETTIGTQEQNSNAQAQSISIPNQSFNNQEQSIDQSYQIPDQSYNIPEQNFIQIKPAKFPPKKPSYLTEKYAYNGRPQGVYLLNKPNQGFLFRNTF